MNVPEAAELFYEIGARFKIDRVRAALIATDAASHWERLALRHLEEDFFEAQARFSLMAAKHHSKSNTGKAESPKITIQNWIKETIPGMKQYEAALAAMMRTKEWTVAKFTIINAQLRELKQGSD